MSVFSRDADRVVRRNIAPSEGALFCGGDIGRIGDRSRKVGGLKDERRLGEGESMALVGK